MIDIGFFSANIIKTTAVFTNEELAIVMAMRCAALSCSAPVTLTSRNLVAPSPSRATSFASSVIRSFNLILKSFSRGSCG